MCIISFFNFLFFQILNFFSLSFVSLFATWIKNNQGHLKSCTLSQCLFQSCLLQLLYRNSQYFWMLTHVFRPVKCIVFHKVLSINQAAVIVYVLLSCLNKTQCVSPASAEAIWTKFKKRKCLYLITS